MDPHSVSCARRLRAEALTHQLAPPTTGELHTLAARIHQHCGHTLIKSHRLAWGWTVHHALRAARRLVAGHPDCYHGLAVAERSWKAWEAGERPSALYQDLLCRLFETNPVQLGLAQDYSPPPRLDSAGHASTQLEHVILQQDAAETHSHVRRITASAVHPSTLDHLHAEIGRLAGDYVAQPLPLLYADIRRLRIDAFEMIATNRHPDQTRRLHLAASYLCGLQAHVCLDLGRYDLASTNAHAAWELAEAAGAADACAWACAMQSLIAYWDGRYADALAAAEAGTPAAIEPTTRTRLHALTARAAARLHDAQRTLRAIGQAAETSDATSSSDHPGGVFDFPTAKQHVYASTALLTLDEPHHRPRAIDHAAHALTLYEAASPMERSSGDILAARLDLATAHLTNRDLDAVGEQLAPVLTVEPAARTASIIKRAAALQQELSQPSYRDAFQARSLRGDLTEFCARPIAITETGQAEE